MFTPEIEIFDGPFPRNGDGRPIKDREELQSVFFSEIECAIERNGKVLNYMQGGIVWRVTELPELMTQWGYLEPEKPIFSTADIWTLTLKAYAEYQRLKVPTHWEAP